MGKKTKRVLLDLLIIAIVTYFGGLLIAGLVNSGFISFVPSDNWADPIALLICGGSLLAYTVTHLDKMGGETSSSKKKKNDKEIQFFEGRLFEEKDLKENFICCKYSELKNQSFKGVSAKSKISYKNSGILVKNEYINGGADSKLCFLPPIHTMVIGNTNTGKTQSVIIPTIQCFAEMQSKPNMIISDLKGELFRDTNHKLVANGYNVLTFNLRDPFKSDRWNPLDRAYESFQRATKLKKEVLVHRGSNPNTTKLKFDPNATFGSAWFEFDGYAYANEHDLETALTGREQSLYGEVTDDITDIINVIIPQKDPSNAMWELGARDFAKAILYSMLEDSKYPELGMTKDKFNFYNFFKIINIKDSGDKMFKTLGKYCDNRSPIFGAKELSNQVVQSSSDTASSFLATLTPNLGLFADPGTAYITSGTDIDFTSFIKKPTAFFLRIPDEKDTMYKLATIAIDQLYKRLVGFSNLYPSLELPRPTYFLLDEFANLPKIEKVANYISVSRSRLIYFYIVLQSYTQLETAYEKAAASTIKENCNVHIFIGSADMTTIEEISNKAGKTTTKVKNESTSKNEGGKDSGGGGKSTSSSENIVERPLIFKEQLRLLPLEKMVILFDKTPAFYSVMNYAFKSKFFDNTKTLGDYRAPKYLDESKVAYSIQGYLDKQSGKSESASGSGKKSIFDDFNFDF